MKKIILTVQPTGKKWRLGLSTNDSREYFVHKDNVKFILSKSLVLHANAVCGTSNKKAYDFNNIDLSKWIEESGFHNYSQRNPSKLIFEYSNNEEGKTLTYSGK